MDKMSNNIREGLNKRKRADNGEQELRGLLNQAASQAMKQFIQKMSTGEIPVDNMADFVRLYGAYKEINDVDKVMEGGSGDGALPQLSMKQDEVIEDKVKEGKLISDGDEEGGIDISSMSMDDVADLLQTMDEAQNKENEGSF